MIAITDEIMSDVQFAVRKLMAEITEDYYAAVKNENPYTIAAYSRDLESLRTLHESLQKAIDAPKIDAVLEAARTLYKESAQFIFDSGERTLQSGITTGRCLALVADIDNILKTYSINGEAHA